MDDDDKTEFGTAELAAPVPRPGAAWAGITLAEEEPRFSPPSSRAARLATPVEESAPDAGRPAAVSSSPARRAARPLSWTFAAIVGAVVGIGAAQAARRWFSDHESVRFPSSVELAPSVDASGLPAGSEPPPHGSVARGAPPVVADSSLEVGMRAPGEEPSPRSLRWSPALSRNVVEALLAGRCSEARALLDASEEPKIEKISTIARRLCRSGGQP